MKNETSPALEQRADTDPAEVSDSDRRAVVRKLAYATPAVAVVMLAGSKAHAQGNQPPGLPSDPFG